MKLFQPRCHSRAWTACLVLLAAAPAFAQQYLISTLAGGTPPGTPVAATTVSIGPPQRVATDSAGNLYFTSQNSVFKVDSTGTLNLIAGNSRAGFSGDGGPAVNAQLNNPQGLAIDPAGNVYIADSLNHRVREVTNGTIQTVAGTGVPGFQPALSPATQTPLHGPSGVALDSSGNLYIADTGNHIIRELTTDGLLHTVAGNSYPGNAGDGRGAIFANLFAPQDVAVGGDGTIYIADTGNARIQYVTGGIINTLAGSSAVGFAGDGGIATSAAFTQPNAIFVDSSRQVYIADFGNDRIRKIDTKGTINTIVGNGTFGFAGDGGAATAAELNLPSGVALDSSGNIYIADQWNLRIRKVASANISTIAGNGIISYSGDGGASTRAQLNNPQGTAVDVAGNVYVADTRNAAIRKITKAGVISSLAGTSLVLPRGIAVDSGGAVYVADYNDNRVKRVATDGGVTTVAGNGSAGYTGDGGAATSATLNGPWGVAVDASGNLYIADFANNVIRKVSQGGISTVAGSGVQGYTGDGGPAKQAALNGPSGIAVDSAGNLYIADTNNYVIREVVAANGNIQTIAGTGLPGSSGDGGLPTRAQLNAPQGIAIDAAGNLYVTEATARVRKILPGAFITTIAGGNGPGYSGDNGFATAAKLNAPSGVSVDTAGNLYVGDAANNAIRLLQPTSSTIGITSLLNGASNAGGAVAPGEVVVLYGSALGASPLTVAPGGSSVATTLAGTTVTFNGTAAPLIYTSPGQVAAVVPFGVTGASAQVVAQYQNQAATIAVSLAQTAPGIFTLDYSGKNQAIAFNQNGTLNGSTDPASIGSQLSIYVTGIGPTNPPSQDGAIAKPPLPAAIYPITVTIGGQPATIASATAVTGQVAGVMQVTVQVPSNVTAGNAVPVTLQVQGISAPAGVSVAVK